MTVARAPLDDLLAAELAAPISSEARRLAEAIRTRHSGAALAVVFYGSCLRRGRAEGIHDFYVVVDDYRSAYASRALSFANAVLPPNVFYLEYRHHGATLRAKYAVISRDDLARGCTGRSRRIGLWARFAQPVAAAWLRDDAAQTMLVGACTDAISSAVGAALSLGGDGWQPVESALLWRRLFRATYGSELRPERSGASDAIYAEQAERFDAVLAAAIAALETSGVLERDAGAAEPRVRLHSPPTILPHPLVSKGMAAAQLAKSALTFGNWLPYALWKVERHSGVRIEASERQRRHPWLFAWPLVFRALRRGALR
jgi:hypothetical protein